MGYSCAQVLPTPYVHWPPDVPFWGPDRAQEGVRVTSIMLSPEERKAALGPRGHRYTAPPSHQSPLQSLFLLWTGPTRSPFLGSSYFSPLQPRSRA